MTDPLEKPTPGPRPRETFELEETGFNEVPKRFRRFYRRWRGPGDKLGPNEALCPVCSGTAHTGTGTTAAAYVVSNGTFRRFKGRQIHEKVFLRIVSN